MIKNTTKDTDAISNLHIVGNIIPPQWYKSIMKKASQKGKVKPKAHLLAINILADIVYWYKNSVKRDELSGEVVEIHKKFKGDLLQRSYASIMEMFSCSMEDAKESIIFLENLGLIKRIFRTENVRDMNIGNIMFIQIFPNMVAKATNQTIPLAFLSAKTTKTKAILPEKDMGKLTDTPVSNGDTPISEISPPLSVISPIGGVEMTHYTYTTIEITTKTSTEGEDTPPQSFENVGTQEIESVIEIIENVEIPTSLPIIENNTETNTESPEKTINTKIVSLDTKTHEIDLMQIQHIVRDMILKKQTDTERWLMNWRSRVPAADMTDIKLLADKVAGDTIMQIMKAEMIDDNDKVLSHINKNKTRVNNQACFKMTNYVNTQNRRVQEPFVNKNIPLLVTKTPTFHVQTENSISPYVGGIYFACMDRNSAEYDGRADITNPIHCPYFDPTSEMYIKNQWEREQAYEIINNKNPFYDR